MTEYNAKDITHLNYFEHIRKYPGMYIGSKDSNGLHHLVKEIISNSVDEYLNGACDKIEVELLPQNGIRITDNGRGIPHGEFSPGVSTLQACFGVENTGGKFNNATGQSGYNTSGGEHGTGGKAVNALSKKLIVTSKRDGVSETVEFQRGKFIKRFTEKIDKAIHGQIVEFYADPTVLEAIDFDYNRIKEMLQEESYLCSGLHLTLISDKKKDEFYSKNGLLDFLNHLKGKEDFIIPPAIIKESESTYNVEIAIGYTNSYNNTVKLFTNNIPQNSGTHLTGFRAAFTLFFNQYARNKKWLKDKEENFNGSDLTEGQYLIINFKMIDPVFKGQNKEELSSSEGRTYLGKFTKDGLVKYGETHEKDLKVLFDKASSARKAREAAKKARDIARDSNKKTTGLKAKMALSEKFIDCTNKDPSKRNLLCVEGMSAGSAAIEARNHATDCIYMLRGKTISPLKTSVDKILANQEMHDIIQVIGAGFGENFDVNKMQFDKVVITSDQDADGAAIELLLIAFFYTYMQPLVKAGKLYRAITPLYICKKGSEEIYFYSDAEYSDWSKTHSGYDTLRAKGLGELNAADLHRVCFERQNFKRINVSDAKKTTDLLYTLEGGNVNLRKQYIYDNAERLGFNFE